MKHHLAQFVVIMVLTMLVTLGVGNTPGAQAQEGTVYITNPANGATITGLVTVTGAASFPDFLKYEIFLKPGKGDLLWVATVYAPVIDGNMARFDTRTYQNGTYQMIIRQVKGDSNYTDLPGPMITIDNPQGAPQPYPEIEPNYLYSTEKYALVRVKNCSGVNLDFDYNSPEGFRSSGNFTIVPKGENTTYCPFEDIVLVPGQYRGTATGQGEKAFSYSFQAEVGKVYELIYNGEGAGRNQFLVNYIQPDKRAGSDKAGTMVAAVAAEPAKVSEPAQAEAAPAPASPAQNTTVLPVSGQGATPKLPFILVGVAALVFVIGGGILTLLWRKGLAG
ncbi:MAG: hypothetical protein U0401_32350 [Anaerolineae bacterium]